MGEVLWLEFVPGCQWQLASQGGHGGCLLEQSARGCEQGPGRWPDHLDDRAPGPQGPPQHRALALGGDDNDKHLQVPGARQGCHCVLAVLQALQ
eukprot:4948567-Lingulodinium_polyedra.AAC.1